MIGWVPNSGYRVHKKRISASCAMVKWWRRRQGKKLVHKPTKPGVWRVEVYAAMGGRMRPWIFSNPILLE